MATTTKVIYRGTADVTSTNLFATTTTTVVTNIVIANTAGSAADATITFDGTVLIPAVSIAANSIATFDLKQVIAGGKIISGFATATTVKFHISGVEIS